MLAVKKPVLPPVELSRDDFRNAMAVLAAAVNVVTTDGPAGRAGFTATAVCSVSDEPPSLLVCLNRNASVYDTFCANGHLCVNTLTSDQQALSNLFGGKTSMAERFATADWSIEYTGSPILDDALVNFDCRISNRVQVGSHDILICEIVGIRQRERGDSLIYFQRSYCNTQQLT
ncbi:FMN reductase [Marinobacter psychrophilus]|jgi:flavin reductase|uniref:FMN reductase n=1 Tax=Marinobacter psychrophilus TaxID=330734 RepID=A0A0H4IC70_9GAMM|nr:pyrimidine utilization flavin reductase protein F [Marinobacter psychrophilus]AKO52632.1 FMN reductase [Marinobacter psychrophilus]